MSMTAKQNQLLAIICNGIVEAVQAAGEQGAPSGPMYAALMSQGCSLSQYESIMAMLVRVGKLRQSGNLYFIAEAK